MRLATATSAPHLARMNCDVTPVLCNAWAASPPSIWHITRPQTPTAGTPTNIRVLPLHLTTTTAADIMEIQHSQSWKAQPLYEGAFHPFDGMIAKLGLSEALGYVLWVFTIVPSWVFMVAISMGSRTFM